MWLDLPPSLQAAPFQSVVYLSFTSTDRVLEALWTYSSGRFDFILACCLLFFFPFPTCLILSVAYRAASFIVLYCLLPTLFSIHPEVLAFLPRAFYQSRRIWKTWYPEFGGMWVPCPKTESLYSSKKQAYIDKNTLTSIILWNWFRWLVLVLLYHLHESLRASAYPLPSC